MIAIFCKTTFIHDCFHNNHKLLVESRPNIYSTAINGITVKLIKIFKAQVNRSIKSLSGFHPLGYSCQILCCIALLFGHVALAMLPHRALFSTKFGGVRLKSKIPTSSKRCYVDSVKYCSYVLLKQDWQEKINQFGVQAGVKSI